MTHTHDGLQSSIAVCINVCFIYNFVIFFRFRKLCHFVCNHSYFGNIVLVCILISSGMLAAEDPLNSKSDRNVVCILAGLLGSI